MPRHLVVSVVVLATSLALMGTLACAPASQVPAAQDATAASGDFAGLVDIGGRSLYLECHGTGSPTVILESGYRASGRYWTDDLLHPDDSRQMVLP